MKTTTCQNPELLLDRLERQILRLRALDHEDDLEQALRASTEMVGVLVQYRHRLKQLEARIAPLRDRAA